MPNEMRFSIIIDADGNAAIASVKHVSDSVTGSADKMAGAYKTLGILTTAEMEKQKATVTAAYNAIRQSGTATADDIVRAERAKSAKILEIERNNFSQRTSLLATLKSNWMAASVAIYAAYSLIMRAGRYIEMGAMAQQAEESYRAVTRSSGIMADKLLADMKRASAGTIDDSALMQKAVKGITQGLNDQEMVKMVEAARVAARIKGEDVETAYEAITDAVANRLPRALIRYGLVMKNQQKILDEAVAAGVADIDLMDLVIANATIRTAQLGGMAVDTAEKLQQFKAQTHDTQEALGKYLIFSLQIGYALFELWAVALLKIVGYLAKFGQGLFWVYEQASKLVGLKGLSNWFHGVGKTLKLVSEDAQGASADLFDKTFKPFEEGAAQKVSAANLAKAQADRDAIIAKMKAAVEAKKNAERVIEIARLVQDVRDREGLVLKTEEEQAVIQLQRRQAREIATLNEKKAAGKLIAEVEAAHGHEIADLEAKQALDRQKVLDDFRAREAAVSQSDQAAALIQLDNKQRDEMVRIKKQTSDKNLLEEAARVQKLERDDFVRKQTAERDSAAAKIAEDTLKSRLDYERKVDEYRVQAGTMSETEALSRRYDSERNLLTVQINTLNVQRERSETRRLEIVHQIEEAQQKIKDSKVYEAFELDVLRIKNETTLRDLKLEQISLAAQDQAKVWSNIFDLVNQAGSEAGKGMGMAATGVKGLSDIMRGQNLVDLLSRQAAALNPSSAADSRALGANIADVMKADNPYATRYAQAVEYYNKMAELYRSNAAAETDLNAAKNAMIEAQERATSAMRIGLAQQTAGALSGVMYALYQATGQQSLEMFRLYQAFAIAETVIATVKAAQDAYAWGWKFGGPYAPALAVASAAIAVAAGMARVATIAATRPGGMASPSSGGGYAYVNPTAPAFQEQKAAAPAQPTQVINYHIYGTVIGDLNGAARALIPYIAKAEADGAH